MKHNPSIAILSAFALVVFLLLSTSTSVEAQEQPAQQSQTQPASQQTWSADELDNLIAPIALYPDPLLSQILVASTYPLEVVEANQWLQRNPNLQGQALLDAAKRQPWDPSIQTLVAVPDALAKLNQDIQWTTDLGNAFLSQEADVMNAVQRMRVRAQANGRLASTPQQTVTTEDQGDQQFVVIQPANPEVVYVPTYDPFYIWGPPVYGFYPALYYPTFGFGFGTGFNLGFCFTNWGGWGFWGWDPSWYSNTIFVNNRFFDRYGYRDHLGRWGSGFLGRTVWVHNPVHRLNVPYRNAQVASRFGGRWSSSTPSRNSLGTGAGRWNTAKSFNRSDSRFSGRTPEQEYRGTSPQTRPGQNPARNQPSRQYGSASTQYRAMSQPQRFQSQSQASSRYQYQAPQQYRSTQQQGTRVVPFGSQPRQSYQAPQQYRPAPQGFQAPQQLRSYASQTPASRFSNGGGFSRGGFGGSGGFSRGNGGGSSRGVGGGRR
jgi:uncharacterized membrane protein YgcG